MAYSPLPVDLAQPKPATEHTKKTQARVREQLNFDDRQSFDDAQRGFIASIDPITIKRPDGHITFDLEQLSFLYGEAPDTVNPSLGDRPSLTLSITASMRCAMGSIRSGHSTLPI